MDKKVTLELTVNQLNVVLAGIIKLPMEVAFDTYNEVQQQVQKQLGDPTKTSGPFEDKIIR